MSYKYESPAVLAISQTGFNWIVPLCSALQPFANLAVDCCLLLLRFNPQRCKPNDTSSVAHAPIPACSIAAQPGPLADADCRLSGVPVAVHCSSHWDRSPPLPLPLPLSSA